MRMLSMVIGILTVMLLLSTLICGLWIQSQNLVNNAGALAFHMKIGVVSVISGVIAAVLLIIQAAKN